MTLGLERRVSDNQGNGTSFIYFVIMSQSAIPIRETYQNMFDPPQNSVRLAISVPNQKIRIKDSVYLLLALSPTIEKEPKKNHLSQIHLPKDAAKNKKHILILPQSRPKTTNLTSSFPPSEHRNNNHSSPNFSSPNKSIQTI